MKPFAALSILALATVASAQIVLKPSGQDAVKITPRLLEVSAQLKSGLAATTWTYTFANAERWQGQADFLIAIPKGGVVTGFAYWYQGEKVVARVAAKDRAATIYRAITSRQRDPALIELVGKRTFRVRVFPIEPQTDLKVELKMVQALDVNARGATLAFPLRSLGKLEKLSVDVQSDRPFTESLTANKGTMWRHETENVVNPDLRLTQGTRPRALVADLAFARSGGSEGFFALTLTASGPLKGMRHKLEGSVYAVHEVARTDRSVTLVGRTRSGAATIRAWLLGTGYRATQALNLPATVEPNAPAVKLWAWSAIGASRSRKEIESLSIRHTVPSKYTSWIAIPTEERKRMARQIARAEYETEVNRALPMILRYGLTAPRSKATLAQLKARAAKLGVNPQEVRNEKLNESANRTGDTWAKAVSKYGERSPLARRLLAELEAFRALGADTYYAEQFFHSRATTLAVQVLEARRAGRPGPRAELERAARYTNQPATQFLRYAVDHELAPLADRIARAERDGKPQRADVALLRILEKNSEQTPNAALRRARVYVAYGRWREADQDLDRVLRAETLDEDALQSVAARQRVEAEIIRQNALAQDNNDLVRWGSLYNLGYEIARDLSQVKRDDAATLAAIERREARLRRAAEIGGGGIGIAVGWKEAYQNLYQQALNALGNTQVEARRRPEEIAQAEFVVRLFEARGVEKKRWQDVFQGRWTEPNSQERAAYVTKRHAGGDTLAEREALAKAMEADARRWGGEYSQERRDYNRARLERLDVLTELDELDRQQADPQVLARKRELEKRAEELRARMGDPIVSVEAPNAKRVAAQMPDGTWLPMHHVAGTGRWEGRFDVPPGVRDGRYEIAVFVDGKPVARVPVNVDTREPRLEWRFTGGRVEVRTDADVARVVAFGADGTRTVLVKEAPGLFGGLARPHARLVATDGAHNRSDMVHAEAPAAAPWTAPETVTALARVGGRLWVGTLNAGSGFAGEQPDEARPWPKSAVTVGERLYVRHAHGQVEGLDAKLPRGGATCLAAEGDRLFVGQIGGWTEFRNGERRDVFPRALSGLVVTALLADGDAMWVGTQGRGLGRYAEGQVEWHDERRGMTDDWITALGRDEAGSVVAGTFVGGALRQSGEGWTVVPGTEGTGVVGIAQGWIATRQGTFYAGARVDATEATTLLVSGEEVWIGTRKGPRRVR